MGKTAVLKSLLPLLDQSGESPCVCKIDCLQSKDAVTFQKMKYPCVTGLSGDICPDHFLVSNLPELWQWTDAMQRNLLVIETAGLCHRCSPATKHMLAGCVVDCTVSCKAPAQHCTASKRLVYLPAHRQNGWKRSIRKNFSLCIQSIYLVL